MYEVREDLKIAQIKIIEDNRQMMMMRIKYDTLRVEYDRSLLNANQEKNQHKKDLNLATRHMRARARS